MVLSEGAAVDPPSAASGVCAAGGPFRSRAAAVADRVQALAAMERDREIVFRPGLDYRERRFLACLRGSSPEDFRSTQLPGGGGDCLRSLFVLWLLPGSGLPRDAAIRAGPPMRRGRRNLSR